MAFTIVFPGLIRKFDGNPFDAETPFGKVQTIAMGDACEQVDVMRTALEHIADGCRDPEDVASEAIRVVRDMHNSEFAAARQAAALPLHEGIGE